MFFGIFAMQCKTIQGKNFKKTKKEGSTRAHIYNKVYINLRENLYENNEFMDYLWWYEE